MRRFAARAALALAVALAALAAPATAQQRSMRIEHFDARYEILRSGDVDVTETLRVRFDGEWNGVERILVARVADPDTTIEREPGQGAYRRTTIEVDDATDAAGTPLRTETNRSGENVTVRAWVPGARDATRTVVFRYTIEDGVGFTGRHDEFYWNVTGEQWRVPIDSVDVLVIPPAGAQPDSVLVWAGAGGSRERNAVARVIEGGATATSTASLPPGSGLTIAVRFPRDVVERPGALDRAAAWIALFWPFVLPLFSVGLMWRHWSARGRDPDRLPVAARYEVPDELRPGEVGTMLDERADLRDVTSTMVDLAVRGHLRIDEVDGTRIFGLELGEDYRFVRTPRDDDELLPHERRLLDALFEDGDAVELSDLKNEFYKDLPRIRDAMMDRLVERGYYTRRPDHVRAFYLIGGGVLFVALMFMTGWLASIGTSPAVFLVPALTAAPIALFGWFMPARTLRGARALERVLGFREFLARVDGDRLRRMSVDPHMFERLLPYAMAMGEEKRWANAFEGIYQEPPQWYHGPPGQRFVPSTFVADLGRMTSRAGSAMSSSPGGSSGGGGSGFSGGGSVGGGGGGGGGGGF